MSHQPTFPEFVFPFPNEGKTVYATSASSVWIKRTFLLIIQTAIEVQAFPVPEGL